MEVGKFLTLKKIKFAGMAVESAESKESNLANRRSVKSNIVDHKHTIHRHAM